MKFFFIAIFFIAGCKDNGTKIATAEGKGNQRSQVFHLSGRAEKLVYEYKSGSDYYGMFALYILKKDAPPMSSPPKVTTVEPSLNGEIKLQETEGDYYIDVVETGNCKVEVYEKK